MQLGMLQYFFPVKRLVPKEHISRCLEEKGAIETNHSVLEYHHEWKKTTIRYSCIFGVWLQNKQINSAVMVYMPTFGQ